MTSPPEMTKPRHAVLNVLKNAGKPMGAYDIIRSITPNPKPPTVYRALEFLEAEGFIHRIASLNAFIVCHESHDSCCGSRHATQFMVCDTCGGVEEIRHQHISPLDLKETGFTPTHIVTEIHGRCANCIP
jgi:Fur family zinc uptake transcriptional regulator